MSFFQTFAAAGTFVICCKRAIKLWLMLFGKSRDRKSGPITLVEMPDTAVVIRSESPNVVVKAGIELARMLSMSSGPI